MIEYFECVAEGFLSNILKWGSAWPIKTSPKVVIGFGAGSRSSFSHKHRYNKEGQFNEIRLGHDRFWNRVPSVAVDLVERSVYQCAYLMGACVVVRDGLI